MGRNKKFNLEKHKCRFEAKYSTFMQAIVERNVEAVKVRGLGQARAHS